MPNHICEQCKTSTSYAKKNGKEDWRKYEGKMYCKTCHRRIMVKLAKMYPEYYQCGCGCGGTIKNNRIELNLFIRGHQVRGERHPNWDHSKLFNPASYTVAIKNP